MHKLYPILAVLAALSLPTAGQSSDADADACAAFAMALACESLARKPEPTPDVTPTAKTCLCSDKCVCGCNENGVCDCNVTPAKPASQPTSYATFAELPAGTYQQIGGRYYPVQSQSMTYVQPQQYAIPSQRYSGFSSSGSCGPGGCR